MDWFGIGKEEKMIPRYENEKISGIWPEPRKFYLWQETELAVIQARAILKRIAQEVFDGISKALKGNAIDVVWLKKREEDTQHDYNAFVDERLRFLSPELQQYFHKDMTSYDGEEAPFAIMLKDSINVVETLAGCLKQTLREMALKYRYTIMNGRTHGQEAQLQTFGKRCLTWIQQIRVSLENLENARQNLNYSKLSGAIGNYGGLDPELEKETLRILGFKPFYGATQIMPRELYAPIAQALCQLVLTIDKIAIDIRLGARSGRPLWQEPFGKKQKGSSIMPQKKNTISTERLRGMARLAKANFTAIMDNIETWEERAIEQSCVERVAWPDLFHIATYSLKTITRVLEGLVVFPDNMMLEIIECRGCYAAGEAKEFLRKIGVEFGLSSEDAYRIVQLAAFNVFEPSGFEKELRDYLPKSFVEADEFLQRFKMIKRGKPSSIQVVIPFGQLRISAQLDATETDVQRWNAALLAIFDVPSNIAKWNYLFSPSYLLANEETLYKEILGA